MQDNEIAPGPDVLVTYACPGVVVLTLNRSKARNALSLSLMSSLREAISQLGAQASTKAIIIAANGPVFSSGHDLKELTAHRADADGGRAFFATAMAACADLMQEILNSPKPVIAAVQGLATAAGCQLVATCDLAIAADTALFGTPGVNIGLFCSTPMVALSRNISRKHAMEMLLLGETLSATQAAQFGLINRVVPADRLHCEAIEVARKIASKSMATVATGKAAFYKQVELPVADAYAYTTRIMVENMMTIDAAEGISAFIEKRTPVWSGTT